MDWAVPGAVPASAEATLGSATTRAVDSTPTKLSSLARGTQHRPTADVLADHRMLSTSLRVTTQDPVKVSAPRSSGIAQSG